MRKLTDVINKYLLCYKKINKSVFNGLHFLTVLKYVCNRTKTLQYENE